MSKNLLDYVGLGYFLEKIKTLFVTALGTSGNNLTWTKNGTTNNITIPYATKSSELVPLQTKQYADVIGTANNNPGAVFYFMSVRPNDWYNPCRVVYKISAEMSGLAAGKAFSIISMVFSRNTVPSYDIWNYIGSTDYRPYYYHYRYLATSTGYNNNYGHLMGIGMNSSYSPTSSTYARKFIVEVLELTNCSVTLFDSMTKYASVPGTGSTNYSGEGTYDGTTNGETHVGDRNDVNYNNREYYASRKTNSALYRYMLCMTKSDGSLVPINSVNNSIATNKTLTTDSFDPFGEIFYWSSTTTYTAGANVGNGSLYRLIMMDLRYSFNYTLGTFTARLPVYLAAVPLINGTAVLYSTPLTQVLPTTEDGLIYIYLGMVYEDASTYRINLAMHHPVYLYKDEGIRSWTATKDVHNYEFEYLTFLALSEGTFTYSNTVGGLLNSNNKISYSLDNGKTWSTESGSVSLSVSLGDKVLWKGNLSTTFGGVCAFGGTASFEVSGNLLSVLFGDNFLADNTIDNYRKCGSIFEGSNCVSASNLILPVNLCNSMFNRMFYGCTSLITAPKLPATTLANYCYSNMFYGCTSLTTTPELPATSLASNCYRSMFYGCTSLTTPPQLPATNLASYCYYQMFLGCTSLTKAPELPATTLPTACYCSMFSGCTSLIEAPELPSVDSMYEDCYSDMFSGCSSLNYIKAMFTITPGAHLTTDWVSGVSATGVFIKNDNATWNVTGVNGVPTGWNDYTESLYEVVRHYELVTTSANGLMSSSDKTKLDGIQLGALVNVVNSVEDNSDSSDLSQYYARKEDNGITLTLSANGTLGIATLNGLIGPSSWGYADLNYFVTGNTVYNAIEPLAPKASPALTGTPTAPTAAAGTNTTQIATTAFVKNAVDSKVHYIANLLARTVANYITEPEVKTIKINGSTTNSASTNNCVLLYDTTNKCLKFIFN